MDSDLPYCLFDRLRPHVSESLARVAAAVPSGCELFLLGGALRASLAYVYHGWELPLLDYDCIFIGHKRQAFDQSLIELGFEAGVSEREDKRLFTMPCIAQPRSPDDYVELEIIYKPQSENISEVLASKTNFTINGFAIAFTDLNSPDWQTKLVQLSTAMADMKVAQLRVNSLQNEAFAYNNLFNAIRFVSQGFARPSDDDVRFMRQAARVLTQEQFIKKVQKTYHYCGGEVQARTVAAAMGIHEDIFDYRTLVEG